MVDRRALDFEKLAIYLHAYAAKKFEMTLLRK
jgi:hypothetical protein